MGFDPFRATLWNLSEQGFLEGGIVNDLPTAQRGINFVRAVANHLRPGQDLIGAFERLNFGPWRPEGEKDIVATLRSLGEYKTRWKGDKLEALHHPFGRRAGLLISWVPSIQGEKTFRGEKVTLRFVEERWSLFLVFTRLLVESVVADLYLDEHPEWQKHFSPVVPPNDVASNLKRLRETKERVKEAFKGLADLLEITEEELRGLDRERYTEILNRVSPA